MADVERSQRIRKKIPRFRILIMGRANAGKTTILQRVCKTKEAPEVFDRKGNKVGAYLMHFLTSTYICTDRPFDRSRRHTRSLFHGNRSVSMLT